MKAIATVAFFATLCSAMPAQAEATEPYVVKAGDSCIAIAMRVLGDRQAVRDIHRLNPQLGPTPHKLVAGTTLTLPALKPSGPDAKLTRAQGDVKIRKPATDEWDPAALGLDLYRAYRVGAASQASAELTFADDGLLGMRERTIVVIYGPEKRQAKLVTATAELERGTLEARLGELDGKPLVVRTGAGEASLRAGDVVVSSTDGGPSVLSNHRGGAVELRGRTKARNAVKVTAGMGTRVLPGKAPEPPRPLPATPAWRTHAGPHLASTRGTIAVAWGAVDRAARYRLAIYAPSGDLVAAHELPASSTALELALSAGPYKLTVAAFDADGLESIPSTPLAIERVVPTFVSPNNQVPAPSAATPRSVARGTTIVAPAGMRCSAGGPAVERVVLERAGSIELRCTDAAGDESDPYELQVVALQTVGSEPAAATLSTSASQPTREERPTRRARGDLGAYGGFQSIGIRTPIELADDSMQPLGQGPVLGIRGSARRRALGAEVDVGFGSFRYTDTERDEPTIAVTVHGMLVREEGHATLRLLAGVGVTTLADDPGDNFVAFSWGGAASLRLVDDVSLRFDLRHQLASAIGGGLGHGVQATVGASLDL